MSASEIQQLELEIGGSLFAEGLVRDFLRAGDVLIISRGLAQTPVTTAASSTVLVDEKAHVEHSRWEYSQSIVQFEKSEQWTSPEDGLAKVRTDVKNSMADKKIQIKGCYKAECKTYFVTCFAKCDACSACDRRYKVVAQHGQIGQVWSNGGACNLQF